MFSTSLNGLMHPSFVSGFIDAEGCFSIGIIDCSAVKTSSRLKSKWDVRPEFKIELNEQDLSLLENIKEFFGGKGTISKVGQKVIYRVRSLKDLIEILPHFDENPLITQKRIDLELLKQVINLMVNKEHLTYEGLLKILSIKASMNKGLSEKLKKAFPDIKPVPRLNFENKEAISPNWLAGFTTGEGCFLIDIYNAKTNVGKGVTLRFSLAQHIRDEKLMKSLVEYFNCGNYYSKSSQPVGDFIIKRFSDITDKLIPFFEKYPLLGSKVKNYEDFKKVVELMKEGTHLTNKGLDEIMKIKSGMNRGRDNSLVKESLETKI